MSRLTVQFYDAVTDQEPMFTLTDTGHPSMQVIDLNGLDGADKAARVVVQKGPDYQPGDHIRLLDEVKATGTDMVSVDPNVLADVNLNLVGFADRAAAFMFVLNPTGSFRVRLDLYDTTSQPYPNLTIYDWELTGGALGDLNQLNFADKTAKVVLATGGGYRPGDHVRLLDTVATSGTDMVTVDPGTNSTIDLNQLGFADRAAAVQFMLNPGSSYRLRADLYDTVGQPYPNIVLYDWQQTGTGPIDLNPLHFADKAARIILAAGAGFHPGDHVRLLDAAQPTQTDMVTADPLVDMDIDLNVLGFADRAAGIQFMLNPSPTFRLRAALYDTATQQLPNIVLYDWVQGSTTFVNLNLLHFADKAAHVVVVQGSGYHEGDHLRLLDDPQVANTDVVSVDPKVQGNVDLNQLGFADRAAGAEFVLNPATTSRLRLDLYDVTTQPYPTLSVYDWETPPAAVMDLNIVHFADKAARAVVAPGSAYHPGDHVRLLDLAQALDTDMVTVDPQAHADVDLNRLGFADRAAGVLFVMNPGSGYRVRVDLYDTTAQPYPNLSLYEWQQPSSGLIDLNPLHFADKTARAVTAYGALHSAGDHVRLLDEVTTLNTDMVDVDAGVHADVDLNQLGFADRAAAVEFILNPSRTWHARADLFDTLKQPYPNIILYDWQQPAGGLFDLNLLHFADKAAAIRIAVGPILRPPIPVPVRDVFEATDGMATGSIPA